MAHVDTRLAGSHQVVPIDPLFDDGPDAMVALCERVGTYRTYAEYEKTPSPLSKGLAQRHDTVLNFLRTGGLHGAEEEAGTLAARTTYFREEYAYGDTVQAPGIEPFVHHPRLIAAAQAVHNRPVVEPAIAYANLMVPGQELAVHTDVPEFRGANRKVLPQWLLVVMHHSGLFEEWRLHIATGISWFHDSEHGALAYWPEGPAGSQSTHRIRANTALVLDTDTVFHGVDRVSDPSPTVVPPVEAGSTLRFSAGGRWDVVAADGDVAQSYGWDELRFSVSWKAYCFADEAARDAWRGHADDLAEQQIVDRLVADLAANEVVDPAVARDRDLGLTLIDHYVHFPAMAPPPGA
jgi:hypothetical protein